MLGHFWVVLAVPIMKVNEEIILQREVKNFILINLISHKILTIKMLKLGL